MEKKGNRNLPLSKVLTTDSKKDGTSSKPYSRGSRRCDFFSGGLSTKPEVSHKPQSQRSKNLDKRPRPRGNEYSHSDTVARNETPWVENNRAELGSVFSSGSKKINISRMVSFHYTIESPQHDRSYYGNKDNRKLMTKKHKYKKEHYLQANCQFIVNNSGDYKQYLNDPDALVDWNLVEQVNLQVSEFPVCPICLYPPVAAKMTRCGHIYCWSCILHYLSFSDKPSRNCPICSVNVRTEELKSVVTVPHSTFNTSDQITFKLMKRPMNCLTAYPVDAHIENEDKIFNMSEIGSQDVHSKLLLASKNDILAIIGREFEELQQQLKSEDSADPIERCFIEQALAALKKRECVVDSYRPDTKCNTQNTIKKVEESVAKLDLNDVESLEGPCNVTPTKIYYFYQASDGQHLYLHGINAMMLKHTYGSLEFGPKTLTGKILEKEGGSMTEDIRRHYRYLRHLPITCQFEVAEIQLKAPVVDKETLKVFHDDLERRKKKRQKRAKEEKRREKHIEVEENRKMGKISYPNLHLESDSQFPVFGCESRIQSESETTLPSDTNTPEQTSSLECSYSGPSFASKCASEKRAAPEWPSLRAGAQVPPSEPQKWVSVTTPKMKLVNAQSHDDSLQDIKDFEAVPVPVLGDLLVNAIKQKKDNEGDKAAKKKKKSKQKVLFATNMAFSGK